MARSTDIVIASAARTPIGAFNGAFASLKGHELGTIAVVEALKRAGVDPAEVNEVILGQVLTPLQILGITITVISVGIVEHARTRFIHDVELPGMLPPLGDDDPR